MDANLMRPPRLEFTFHPSIVAVAFENPEMGNGLTAAFKRNRHPYAVFRMSSDRGIDDAFFFGNIAVDQGPVGSMRRMGLDLLGKPFVSLIGLRGDHDTGRVLIQTMNDTRPDNAVDPGQFPPDSR